MIENVDIAIRKLEKIQDVAMKSLAKALNIEAEKIMADSKENFVPVDFSPLKNSGHVETPVVSGDSVSINLGYGNQAVGYAMIVHEDLTANHTVGEAKYLEKPFNNAKNGQKKRLSSAVRKDVKAAV